MEFKQKLPPPSKKKRHRIHIRTRPFPLSSRLFFCLSDFSSLPVLPKIDFYTVSSNLLPLQHQGVFHSVVYECVRKAEVIFHFQGIQRFFLEFFLCLKKSYIIPPFKIMFCPLEIKYLKCNNVDIEIGLFRRFRIDGRLLFLYPYFFFRT